MPRAKIFMMFKVGSTWLTPDRKEIMLWNLNVSVCGESPTVGPGTDNEKSTKKSEETTPDSFTSATAGTHPVSHVVLAALVVLLLVKKKIVNI